MDKTLEALRVARNSGPMRVVDGKLYVTVPVDEFDAAMSALAARGSVSESSPWASLPIAEGSSTPTRQAAEGGEVVDGYTLVPTVMLALAKEGDSHPRVRAFASACIANAIKLPASVSRSEPNGLGDSDTQMMAECMIECRDGLISTGIIDASVPPMFVAEAVIAKFRAASRPPSASEGMVVVPEQELRNMKTLVISSERTAHDAFSWIERWLAARPSGGGEAGNG